VRYATLLILVVGCGPRGSTPRGIVNPALDVLPADCRQAITIHTASGKTVDVFVWAYERDANGEWDTVFPPFSGTVGRNGITSAESKKEGDGCTPAGVYRIGPAFGYARSGETGLNYRQATANDFWVDDPDSPDYNRWVVGKPTAKSFELMKRADDLYEVGAVIRYNLDPVFPGKGSAIFLHVWPGPGKPTAGCVALDKANVNLLLGWLNEAANPRIVIVER
jgi:L,D-peptidoglycan transpeptidase YkuD (ErfK/YbiS/YcfS/YnhG family)